MKFRPIVKHARLLVAVSEFTKQRLVTLLGVAPERIAVVGNGVDDMFFEPPPGQTQRIRGLHGGNPYVLVTGGLTAKKGGGSVLAVAEELLRRKSPLRFVVVGFHNDENLIERSRALPNVMHAGHVDDESYHSLLGHSAGLLFLSRYEGFGIPIVEAMAMGKTVIASTFASIPEVVGDAGYLVDVNRPADIADLLERLVADPGSAADMIVRGRERAARCRWSSCVERLEHAFAEHS
jgi:glycosyltransferase involved in cell wall biosynthesis